MGKEYKFKMLRFAMLVLLGRLLVAFVFALVGMGVLVILFMSLILGGMSAAMIEGEKKGSTDKTVPSAVEWSRVKRGMLIATLMLDVVIAAALVGILIAGGEPEAVATLMSPNLIISMVICYAAIAVVMPLSYYAWAKKAAAPITFK